MLLSRQHSPESKRESSTLKSEFFEWENVKFSRSFLCIYPKVFLLAEDLSLFQFLILKRVTEFNFLNNFARFRLQKFLIPNKNTLVSTMDGEAFHLKTFRNSTRVAFLSQGNRHYLVYAWQEINLSICHVPTRLEYVSGDGPD